MENLQLNTLKFGRNSCLGLFSSLLVFVLINTFFFNVNISDHFNFIQTGNKIPVLIYNLAKLLSLSFFLGIVVFFEKLTRNQNKTIMKFSTHLVTAAISLGFIYIIMELFFLNYLSLLDQQIPKDIMNHFILFHSFFINKTLFMFLLISSFWWLIGAQLAIDNTFIPSELKLFSFMISMVHFMHALLILSGNYSSFQTIINSLSILSVMIWVFAEYTFLGNIINHDQKNN